jgi:catechol 2,3-dioxygenase-like lactoylglutathione lyase family enzyme
MPADDPRLDQLNIVVRDMEAAVAFYRRIGFEIPDTPAEWAEWQPHHRTITTPEGFTVDLDSAAFAASWGGVSGGTVIGVRLPTRYAVDELHADLVAAGHESLHVPYDAFWGARYALVRDPDGNPVGLMSPVDEARRTPTPVPPTS